MGISASNARGSDDGRFTDGTVVEQSFLRNGDNLVAFASSSTFQSRLSCPTNPNRFDNLLGPQNRTNTAMNFRSNINNSQNMDTLLYSKSNRISEATNKPIFPTYSLEYTNSSLNKLQHRVNNSILHRNAGVREEKSKKEVTVLRILEYLSSLRTTSSVFSIAQKQRVEVLQVVHRFLQKERSHAQRPFAHKRRGEPLPHAQLKEVGIAMLATLVKSYDYSADPSILWPAIVSVAKAISIGFVSGSGPSAPAYLFSEWSPTPAFPEVELIIDPSNAVASSVESAENSAAMALQWRDISTSSVTRSSEMEDEPPTARVRGDVRSEEMGISRMFRQLWGETSGNNLSRLQAHIVASTTTAEESGFVERSRSSSSPLLSEPTTTGFTIPANALRERASDADGISSLSSSRERDTTTASNNSSRTRIFGETSSRWTSRWLDRASASSLAASTLSPLSYLRASASVGANRSERGSLRNRAWRSKRRRNPNDPAYWRVSLDRVHPISSVVVRWASTQIPSHCALDISDASDTVPPVDDEDGQWQRVCLILCNKGTQRLEAHGISARHLRLRMSGFHPLNRKNCFGIEEVVVKSVVPHAVCTAPADSLQSMQEWLSHIVNAQEIRQKEDENIDPKKNEKETLQNSNDNGETDEIDKLIHSLQKNTVQARTMTHKEKIAVTRNIMKIRCGKSSRAISCLSLSLMLQLVSGSASFVLLIQFISTLLESSRNLFFRPSSKFASPSQHTSAPKEILEKNITDATFARENRAALSLLVNINDICDEEKRLRSRTSKSQFCSMKNSSGSQLIEASFDRQASSASIDLRSNGQQVHSNSSSNSHALVDVGFSGTGRFAWEFRLESDKLNDEMTCVGAAIRPVSDSNYERSESLWMYRAYNGNLYSRSRRVIQPMSKWHPGDVVRVELDLDKGTISFSVNGESQGIAFTGVTGNGEEIFPACTFYGTGRAVTLLKVERIGAPRNILPYSAASLIDLPVKINMFKNGDQSKCTTSDAVSSVIELPPVAKWPITTGTDNFERGDTENNVSHGSEIGTNNILRQTHDGFSRVVPTVMLDTDVTEKETETTEVLQVSSDIVDNLAICCNCSAQELMKHLGRKEIRVDGIAVPTNSLCMFLPEKDADFLRMKRKGGKNLWNSHNTFPSLVASYDLTNTKFRSFQGRVAFEDDSKNNSIMSFSISGDSKLLWEAHVTSSQSRVVFTRSTSKQNSSSDGIDISNYQRLCTFSVDISGVSKLIIRVTCIPPISNGKKRHRIIDKVCPLALWLSPHLSLSPPSPPMKIRSLLCSRRSDGRPTRGDVAESILNVVVKLSAIHCGFDINTSKDPGKLEKSVAVNKRKAKGRISDEYSPSTIDLELPYCLQVSLAAFSQIRRLLDVQLPLAENIPENNDNEDNDREQAESICVSLLRLVSFHLQRLIDAHVRPEEVGLSSSAFEILNSTLKYAIGNDKLMHYVRLEAVNAVEVGLELLYPSSRQRFELLASLIKEHRNTPYDINSPRYALLNRLLMRFSTSAKGVVSLLPIDYIAEVSVNPIDSIKPTNGSGKKEILSKEKSISIADENIRPIKKTRNGIGYSQEELLHIADLLSMLFSMVSEKSLFDINASSEKNTSNDEASFIGSDKMNVKYKLKKDECTLIASADALLYAYQRHLVSLAASCRAATEPPCQVLRRYGSLLLYSCRRLLDTARKQLDCGAPPVLVERLLQGSFVGTLLPTFATALSLLSSRLWLASVMLPSIVQLCASVSKVVEMLPAAKQSKDALECVDAMIWEESAGPSALANTFKVLYTGVRDNWDGQVGFEFVARKCVELKALGRAVNPDVNGGQLQRTHVVRLWLCRTRELLVEVSIDDNSPRDELGYAYSELIHDVMHESCCRTDKKNKTVCLEEGENYRITSSESSGSGDPWYDRNHQSKEQYDNSIMEIIKDCYSQGNTDKKRAEYPSHNSRTENYNNSFLVTPSRRLKERLHFDPKFMMHPCMSTPVPRPEDSNARDKNSAIFSLENGNRTFMMNSRTSRVSKNIPQNDTENEKALDEDITNDTGEGDYERLNELTWEDASLSFSGNRDDVRETRNIIEDEEASQSDSTIQQYRLWRSGASENTRDLDISDMFGVPPDFSATVSSDCRPHTPEPQTTTKKMSDCHGLPNRINEITFNDEPDLTTVSKRWKLMAASSGYHSGIHVWRFSVRIEDEIASSEPDLSVGVITQSGKSDMSGWMGVIGNAKLVSILHTSADISKSTENEKNTNFVSSNTDKCTKDVQIPSTSKRILEFTLKLDISQCSLSLRINHGNEISLFGPNSHENSNISNNKKSNTSPQDKFLPEGTTFFPAIALRMNKTRKVYVSLYGAGLGGSTLCLHPLHDMQKVLASLGGQLAATMVAGVSQDDEEDEASPWLTSPLLSGGLMGSYNKNAENGNHSISKDVEIDTPICSQVNAIEESFVTNNCHKLRWPANLNSISSEYNSDQSEIPSASPLLRSQTWSPLTSTASAKLQSLQNSKNEDFIDVKAVTFLRSLVKTALQIGAKDSKSNSSDSINTYESKHDNPQDQVNENIQWMLHLLFAWLNVHRSQSRLALRLGIFLPEETAVFAALARHNRVAREIYRVCENLRKIIPCPKRNDSTGNIFELPRVKSSDNINRNTSDIAARLLCGEFRFSVSSAGKDAKKYFQDLLPSDAMLQTWDNVISLRRWLQKRKQHFKATVTLIESTDEDKINIPDSEKKATGIRSRARLLSGVEEAALRATQEAERFNSLPSEARREMFSHILGIRSRSGSPILSGMSPVVGPTGNLVSGGQLLSPALTYGVTPELLASLNMSLPPPAVSSSNLSTDSSSEDQSSISIEDQLTISATSEINSSENNGARESTDRQKNEEEIQIEKRRNRVAKRIWLASPQRFSSLRALVIERAHFLMQLLPIEDAVCEIGGSSDDNDPNYNGMMKTKLNDAQTDGMTHGVNMKSSHSVTKDRGGATRFSSGVLSVLEATNKFVRTKSRESLNSFSTNPSFPRNNSIASVAESTISQTDEQPFTSLNYCTSYIREGGRRAPPAFLIKMLQRRAARARQRIFGLRAFAALLDVLPISATHDVVAHLRPALRGRRVGRGQTVDCDEDISNTERIAISASTGVGTAVVSCHHPLKALEGCPKLLVSEVKEAFEDLYTELSSTMRVAVQRKNASITNALFWNWCIDWRASDSSFLLKSRVIPVLRNCFSFNMCAKQAQTAVAMSAFFNGKHEKNETNQKPQKEFLVKHNRTVRILPIQYIRQSLITGTITKFDLLILMYEILALLLPDFIRGAKLSRKTPESSKDSKKSNPLKSWAEKHASILLKDPSVSLFNSINVEKVLIMYELLIEAAETQMEEADIVQVKLDSGPALEQSAHIMDKDTNIEWGENIACWSSQVFTRNVISTGAWCVYELLTSLTLGGEQSRRIAEMSRLREQLQSIPGLMSADEPDFTDTFGNGSSSSVKGVATATALDHMSSRHTGGDADAGLALGAATVEVASCALDPSKCISVNCNSDVSNMSNSWETQLFMELHQQIQIVIQLLIDAQSSRSIQSSNPTSDERVIDESIGTGQDLLIINPFSINAYLRKLLGFAVTVSNLKAAQAQFANPVFLGYLIKNTTLPGLSPCNRFLVSRLLRTILPPISLPLLRGMKLVNDFDLLIDSALITIGSTLFVQVPEKSTNKKTTVPARCDELLGLLQNPVGHGTGVIVLSRVSELLNLLRVLMNSRNWRRRVTGAIRQALADVREYIQNENLKCSIDEDTEKSSKAASSEGSKSDFEQPIMARSIAALAVLGGYCDYLCVGGRVSVRSDARPPVNGTLLQYTPGATHVVVAFGSIESAFTSVSQRVAVNRVSPIAEIPAVPSALSLAEQSILPVILALLSIKNNTKKSTKDEIKNIQNTTDISYRHELTKRTPIREVVLPQSSSSNPPQGDTIDSRNWCSIGKPVNIVDGVYTGASGTVVTSDTYDSHMVTVCIEVFGVTDVFPISHLAPNLPPTIIPDAKDLPNPRLAPPTPEITSPSTIEGKISGGNTSDPTLNLDPTTTNTIDASPPKKNSDVDLFDCRKNGRFMLLRSLALKALSVMLHHKPSAHIAIQYGSQHVATSTHGNDSKLTEKLFNLALAPIDFSGFAPLAQLEERRTELLHRLHEATGLGDSIFNPALLKRSEVDTKVDFDKLKKKVLENHDKKRAKNTKREKESEKEDQVEAKVDIDNSPAIQQRRVLATNLVRALGFDMNQQSLCERALQRNGDDVNAAAEWLMVGGAAVDAVRRELESTAHTDAMRVYSDDIDNDSTCDATDLIVNTEEIRHRKAGEMVAMLALPFWLAEKALELHNGDMNASINWAMDAGSRYTSLDNDSSDILRLGQHTSNRSDVRANEPELRDAAALEDLGDAVPLVAETSNNSQSGYTGSLTLSRNQSSVSAESEIIVSVASDSPIIQRSRQRSRRGNSIDNDESQTSISGTPAATPLREIFSESPDLSDRLKRQRIPELCPVQLSSLSYKKLGYNSRCDTALKDPEVCAIILAARLRPGVIVTEYKDALCNTIKDKHTCNDGRMIGDTGIVLSKNEGSNNFFGPCGETEVRIRFLEVETAMPMQKRLYSGRVCAHKRIFGHQVDSISDLWNLLAETEIALASHYARRALAVLLTVWMNGIDREAQEAAASSDPWSPKRMGMLFKNIRVSKIVDLCKLATAAESVDGTEDGDITISDERYRANTRNRLTHSQGVTFENNNVGSITKGSQAQVLRTILKRVFIKEAEQQQASGLKRSKEDDGSVTWQLVTQCESDFHRIVYSVVGSSDSNEIKTRESLHPFYGESNYTGDISFRKTINVEESKKSEHKALRVSFDPRCELADKDCDLTFFLDKNHTSTIASFTGASPSNWKPFVVHADTIYFRFNSSFSSSENPQQWGYRFFVRPIRGLQWTAEPQVLRDASLEWGCWVLDFLLNDVCGHAVPGCVHNKRVYGALLRYLRSGGSLFKGRVVSLLSQLLKSPGSFPPSEHPDLTRLHSIGKLAMARATSPSKQESLFLPSGLLGLIELALTTKIAEHELALDIASDKSVDSSLVDDLSSSEKTIDSNEIVRSSIKVTDDFNDKSNICSIPINQPWAQKWELPISPVVSNPVKDLSPMDQLIDLYQLSISLCIHTNKKRETQKRVIANADQHASKGGETQQIRNSLGTNIGTDSISNSPSFNPSYISVNENVENENIVITNSSCSLDKSNGKITDQSNTSELSIQEKQIPSRLFNSAWMRGVGELLVLETCHPMQNIPKTTINKIDDIKNIFASNDSFESVIDAGATVTIRDVDERGCKTTSETEETKTTKEKEEKVVEEFDEKHESSFALNNDNKKASFILETSNKIRLRGARSLCVWLDPRCELNGKDTLRLEACDGGKIAKKTSLCFGGPAWSKKLQSEIEDAGRLRKSELDRLWRQEPIIVRGDSLYYTFSQHSIPGIDDEASDSKDNNCWGWALTIAPYGDSRPEHFRLLRLVRHLNQVVIDRQAMSEWTAEMDTALVQVLNERSAIVDKDTSWSCTATFPPQRLRLSHKELSLVHPYLLQVSLQSLFLRCAVLQMFNTRLTASLRLVKVDTEGDDITSGGSKHDGNHISKGHKRTLGTLLRRLKHCVFLDVKMRQLDAALLETQCKRESGLSVTLDNQLAMLSRDLKELDLGLSQCIFAQAFRQLHFKRPSLLRSALDSKERLFFVRFKGEEGADWGGVFREGCSRMIEDVFSKHFPLLLPCPNALHEHSYNADKFLPNPALSSPLAIQMFEFLGKLMGISLRHRLFLPFNFSSFVWKQILNESPSRKDWEEIDHYGTHALDHILNCEEFGISDDRAFQEGFPDLRFVTSGSDGSEVELIPGGREHRVHFINRYEYCSLVEQYRLGEFAVQADAIRRGFATIVPLRALTLFTWQQLEVLVGGRPEVDVSVLRKHTVLEGYERDDPVLTRFWSVLESMSNEERSKFIRFVWGRSRLPNSKDWSRPFKIQKRDGTGLPRAHTCFFSIELPPYATQEEMRKNLLICCHHGIGGVLLM